MKRWASGDDSRKDAAVRERFESALRVGATGTWHWDLRSGTVEWDAALEELFGIAPGSFEGTFEGYAKRIHPQERHMVLGALERALRCGDPDYSLEHRIILPGGDDRWVHVAARVARDEHGAATEMVGVVVDASHRRRAEAEMASLMSAADGAQRALDSAQRRLALLSRVGERLTTPLGLEVALHQIADLLVEVLADWCVIDIIDRGQVHRAAVAHRDLGQSQIADVLRQQVLTPPEQLHLQRESVYVPDLCANQLDDVLTGAAHRRLLEVLSRPSSYLALPLVADDQHLGTMTLVTTDGWYLDADDVQLASEIARRCAAVADKAVLTAALARAIRALEDMKGPDSAFRQPTLGRRDDEAARIAAVHRYDVLDTPGDGSFDRITALAARLFDVPIAIVSIVDIDRIWFTSHHGLDAEQVDRSPGLCASAILGTEPWVVTNAAVDPRTMANPLVAAEMGLRFYAGAPLVTHDGFNLGTLCVIDRQPRSVTQEELATLTDLAAVVMDELEIRRAARQTVLTR